MKRRRRWKESKCLLAYSIQLETSPLLFSFYFPIASLLPKIPLNPPFSKAIRRVLTPIGQRRYECEQDRFRSLWDMYEFKAYAFVQIAQLLTWIEQYCLP